MKILALILLFATPLGAQDDKDVLIERLTNRFAQLQLNLHNQNDRANQFELRFLRLQVAFSDSIAKITNRLVGVYNDAATILAEPAVWAIADTVLKRLEAGTTHPFRTIVERRNGTVTKE